jgi:hypothetical protein
MGIPYVLEETTAGISNSTEKRWVGVSRGEWGGFHGVFSLWSWDAKRPFDTIPAVGSGRLTGSHAEQKSETQKVV